MAGRLLNWAVCFGMTALIIFASDDARPAALATIGLFLFPYYLGVSAHLYPDVIGAAFLLLGLIAHLERKPVVSAVSWSLAIATRQYAVAFPSAVSPYGLLRGRRNLPGVARAPTGAATRARAA